VTKKTGKKVRLPTEQQWEYAARGGTKTAYIWGDDPGAGGGWGNCPDAALKRVVTRAMAFGWDDGYTFTSPAGRFKPNGMGLYDMIGNAMQWTSDRYDDKTGPDPVRTDSMGIRYYDFYRRIVRGGAWYGYPDMCRTACRAPYYPDHPGSDIGFRIVMDRGLLPAATPAATPSSATPSPSPRPTGVSRPPRTPLPASTTPPTGG
jgi:formylglycine-generating enzyme required for sulfatase activity